MKAPKNNRRIVKALVALGGLLLLALFLLTVVLPVSDDAPIPGHLILAPHVDSWTAGKDAYDRGDFEEAAAYWKQVPRDHPAYARSLRYIGWELHAGKNGEPRKALNYVHRSVLAEPFDGNTWQDLGRTYGALLGFDSGPSKRGQGIQSESSP